MGEATAWEGFIISIRFTDLHLSNDLVGYLRARACVTHLSNLGATSHYLLGPLAIDGGALDTAKDCSAIGRWSPLGGLRCRPVFVGVERDLIRAAIDAEPQVVRAWLIQSVRPDRAGGRIVPLGEARHIIRGA